MSPPRTAITLVETVVVIGLVGALSGLLLPAVQSARDTASRAGCQDHMRQIGIASQNYCAAHGYFPASGGVFPDRDPRRATPARLLSWMAQILPYIDRDDLWRTADAACRSEARPYVSPPHVGYSTPVKLYICPAEGRLDAPVTSPKGRVLALTSFIGVGGTLDPDSVSPDAVGVMTAAPGVLRFSNGTRVEEITDGTSHTIMVAERPPPNSFQAGQWYQSAWILERFGGPDGIMFYIGPVIAGDPCSIGGAYGPGRLDNPCDRLHFWSLHRSGSNFLFADGSVRFLAYSARPIIPALITRAGGEVVELP